MARRRQSICRRCCICRLALCGAFASGLGKARGRATLVFGRRISIALTASMRPTADGVRKSPISSFGCYTLAYAAGMGRSRPACFIFGTTAPIDRCCPRMSGSLPELPPVIGFAHCRVCRRFRARPQRSLCGDPRLTLRPHRQRKCVSLGSFCKNATFSSRSSLQQLLR